MQYQNNILAIIFFLISYIFIFCILLAIIIKRYSRHYQFEYVWFCSKIKTIENLVKITSSQYQIFNDISPSGKISGLSTNYYNLLKLNTGYGCNYNYRPCGYLDTLNNFLCIDREYSCPINQLVVDYSSNKNSYLDNGYQFASNISYLTYNCYLYFSKTQIYGNGVIMLAKSINRPFFIDYYNFNLDLDAFNEVFSNIKMENKDDSDKRRRISSFEDIVFEELIEASFDAGEKVFGNLIGILENYETAKKHEKFLDYITKKIEEDDDNIDTYFRYIGDNYYVKNYIGFQSVSDLENFLNINFGIYKSSFPNKPCGIFAIICFIIYFFKIVIYISGIISDQRKDFFVIFHIIAGVIYLFIWFGFISYFGYIYTRISNDQNLVLAKQIKSDAFINNFLEEFISKTSKSLSEWVIGIFTVSIISHIIGIVLFIINI